MPVSGRQLGAALTATRGQDGATGAGPHAGTESVRATAAPVTRLERALAHGALPVICVVARPQAHGNRRLGQRPVYFTRQPSGEQTVSSGGPGAVHRGPRRGVWRFRQMVVMTSRWTRQENPFRAATSTNTG